MARVDFLKLISYYKLKSLRVYIYIVNLEREKSLTESFTKMTTSSYKKLHMIHCKLKKIIRDNNKLDRDRG